MKRKNATRFWLALAGVVGAHLLGSAIIWWDTGGFTGFVTRDDLSFYAFYELPCSLDDPESFYTETLDARFFLINALVWGVAAAVLLATALGAWKLARRARREARGFDVVLKDDYGNETDIGRTESE